MGKRFISSQIVQTGFRGCSTWHWIDASGSFHGVNLTVCEAKHSPLPRIKVKNKWSYNYTPSMYLHGVCRNSCIFVFMQKEGVKKNVKNSFEKSYFILMYFGTWSLKHITRLVEVKPLLLTPCWRFCFVFEISRINGGECRSQWPSGLRRGSAATHLLGLRVRIPPRAWMFVCCECCVFVR